MALNPMRILMVSRSLPCHLKGGLEHHVIDLARGLVREGAAVELLSTEAPAEYRESLRSEGIELHELRGIPAGRYSPAYFSRIGRRIFELADSRAYDVIHGHEFAFGLGLPKRLSGNPGFVLSVHGTITSETPLHRDVFAPLPALDKLSAIARYGRRWLYAPLWHRALDRANALLVDSQFTWNELARIRPRIAPKIRLIPLGIGVCDGKEILGEEARARLGWKSRGDSGPILVTVGRLQRQKGHEIALEALAELRDLRWNYVIVGEGPERHRLQALRDRLGLGVRVEFVGRVDEETKANYLAAADLFLWPERTHPAFGLVGAEAMLAGTPVLASRRGAIPELIDEQSGWLFDPGRVENLRDALRRLLLNPALLGEFRRDLSRRAHARFDVVKMARSVFAVYADLRGAGEAPAERNSDETPD